MNPEEAFQRQVIDLAHLRGWRVAHFRTAQSKRGAWITPVAADGKGFPDLVLVRDRVLFVELKAPGKYPSPAQREWLDALKTVAIDPRRRDWRGDLEVYVWRPEDWPEVQSLLT